MATQAEFIKGIKGTDPILKSGLPQIAFIGRSNVGKSSVINSLLGRKSLVKSSSTPGKTKEINFFLIDKNKYFVDLPGYGFASVSQKQAEKIRNMIIWYFSSSEAEISKVVFIIDAKVGPTRLDHEMFEILKECGHDVVIIANKEDKLKQKDKRKQLEKIKNELSDNVIYYSAKTKKHKKELLGVLGL